MTVKCLGQRTPSGERSEKVSGGAFMGGKASDEGQRLDRHRLRHLDRLPDGSRDVGCVDGEFEDACHQIVLQSHPAEGGADECDGFRLVDSADHTGGELRHRPGWIVAKGGTCVSAALRYCLRVADLSSQQVVVRGGVHRHRPRTARADSPTSAAKS
jgi:hypothetical protein